MKGIMIYEAPFWGDEENTVYTHEVTNASYTLKQFGSDDITCYLEGTAAKGPVTKATCSKDDTYDFETGALISLMKMCGKEKALKAVEELYSLKEPRGADLDGDVLESKAEYYEKENKILKEKNAELVKGNSALVGARDYLLIESRNRLRDKMDLKEKYVALVAENEKLKLDCEKLQHGYIDTDMIFCGGRQNGKQYMLLVDLFKKIDQKKVDAAYKEAYNTTLPVWQKEFLRQAYEIRKESKEKTELPRTLDINGTVYRKSIQIKDFGEEIIKPSSEAMPSANLFTISKREKMWDDILKEGRTPVYVKRKDFHDFFEECQAVGIKWVSGKLSLEGMPFYMTDGYEGAYFFVMTSLDISKSKRGAKEFRHVMTWWATASDEEAKAAIHYIRPMRWDLFEKGRLAVKVNYNNYKDFYAACEKELGKKPSTAYTYGSFSVSINKKDGLFNVFTVEHQKKTGRKIVDWEDVR